MAPWRPREANVICPNSQSQGTTKPAEVGPWPSGLSAVPLCLLFTNNGNAEEGVPSTVAASPTQRGLEDSRGP